MKNKLYVIIMIFIITGCISYKGRVTDGVERSGYNMLGYEIYTNESPSVSNRVKRQEKRLDRQEIMIELMAYGSFICAIVSVVAGIYFKGYKQFGSLATGFGISGVLLLSLTSALPYLSYLFIFCVLAAAWFVLHRYKDKGH